MMPLLMLLVHFQSVMKILQLKWGAKSPQTESDVVLELQRKIELLETQLADCQGKLNEAEKENALLLERQFSIDKIKDDNAAVLFYTGFPSYEALISFQKCHTGRVKI